MPRRLRELDSVVLFVGVTLGLTLVSALAMRPVAEAIEPSGGAMLGASIVYVTVIGWPPLVAFVIVRTLCEEKRPFDDGIRAVSLKDSLLSVVIALFILVVAFVLDAIINRSIDGLGPQFAVELSVWALARHLVAFVAVIGILWLQAIVEELAWRGFVLPRLMRTFGAWPGLIAHGVLWGLCYSAVLATSGSTSSQSIGFVVTCALLGVLLGWLRLSARSIYASAATNATLTICAGLPMFLVGHGSRFSPTFAPSGWISMTIVILLIICHRPSRATITIPWRPMPEHVN